MWPWNKKPKTVQTNLLPVYLQLDRIENNIHYLYSRNKRMTVAYDELTAAVSQAVNDIAALAAKIAAVVPVAGTSDEQLATLTAQLKAATDAVVAVLAPPAA